MSINTHCLNAAVGASGPPNGAVPHRADTA